MNNLSTSTVCNYRPSSRRSLAFQFSWNSITQQQFQEGDRLSLLTKDLWLCCMERNILLQSQYLSGFLNAIVDKESRKCSDQMFRPVIIEAFTHLIRENQSLSVTFVHGSVFKQAIFTAPIICELEAKPSGISFTKDWNSLPKKLYTNSPWSLIGWVLSLVHY